MCGSRRRGAIGGHERDRGSNVNIQVFGRIPTLVSTIVAIIRINGSARQPRLTGCCLFATDAVEAVAI